MNNSNQSYEAVNNPKNLYSQVRIRTQTLKSVIETCKKTIAKADEGCLSISNSNGVGQYYLVAQHRKKYLRKNEQITIRELSQKEYCNRIQKKAEKELAVLIKVVDYADENDPDYLKTTHLAMHKGKQPYIKPVLLDDDEYVRRWLAEDYTPNPYKPEEKVHKTMRGEFVRSKTEMNIANHLYIKGIPYKYECPLVINGRTFYPDFTILDPVTRKVYYLEHAGMMDDQNYVNGFIKKQNYYQQNGVIQGKNLLITYESLTVPFDLQSFEAMLTAHGLIRI